MRYRVSHANYNNVHCFYGAQNSVVNRIGKGCRQRGFCTLISAALKVALTFIDKTVLEKFNSFKNLKDALSTPLLVEMATSQQDTVRSKDAAIAQREVSTHRGPGRERYTFVEGK